MSEPKNGLRKQLEEANQEIARLEEALANEQEESRAALERMLAIVRGLAEKEIEMLNDQNNKLEFKNNLEKMMSDTKGKIIEGLVFEGNAEEMISLDKDEIIAQQRKTIDELQKQLEAAQQENAQLKQERNNLKTGLALIQMVSMTKDKTNAEQAAEIAELQKQLASGSTGRGSEMDQVLASLRTYVNFTQPVPPRMVVPADGKPVNGKTNPGQGK